jgi:hypothetical protein
MDHETLEREHVVDRYLLGQLPPAERASFEEHYLSCRQCLDRLELAEAMQRGFKRAAGQDAAQLAAVHQLAVVAWLARLGRPRQMAVLAMTLCAAVVLPAGLALWRTGPNPGTSARGAAESVRLRSELSQERAARARDAADVAQARLPQRNVPILFLGVERGAGGGGPTHQLRLPEGSGSAVLALEIDPPHRPAYRVVLRAASGREVWSGGDLELDERETLTLALPASLLAPGDYTLAVEGLTPGRPPAAAGRFTFRVLPAR